MRPTRRGWEVAAITAVMAGLAVLFAVPLLLIVAAVFAGWLLASQLRFVLTLSRLKESLTIDQATERSVVTPGESVLYTLRARGSVPPPLTATIRADLPARISVESGIEPTLNPTVEDSTTATISLPVAGAITIDPPILEATDAAGLLRSTAPVGEPIDLVAEPGPPLRMHVGQGGQAAPAAFGEHEGGEIGEGGTIPAGLRAYVPGDPANRIDWKATARLTEPYVREFEPQTALQTAIVIDHRSSMATGVPGETTFDFARELALRYLAAARAIDDPVALYAIGDEGLTYRLTPAASDRQYDRVRRRLLELEPTSQEHSPAQHHELTTTEARDLLERLPDDEFGTSLRPFLEDRPRYVRRLRDRPLYEGLRVAVTDLQTARRVVVITDDTDRTPLYEGAKLVRGGESEVLLFVLPSVLFEPGGLGELDAAYRRYLEFEEYRGKLAGLPGVQAYEVAPGDRLQVILAEARERRVAA